MRRLTADANPVMRRTRRPGRIALLLVLIAGLSYPAGAVVLFDENGDPIDGSSASDPRQWPELLALDGHSQCSAVAVGPRAVLTAGFCVPEGAAGEVRVGEDPTPIVCERSPEEDDGTSLLALCAAQRPLALERYAQINTDPGRLSPGAHVTLTGYGCQYRSGVDDVFGKLGAGKAMLIRPPAEDGIEALVQGEATLCAGDAGGGAFVDAILVGINTKSDELRRSYIASTSAPRVIAWAVDWSNRLEADICGLEGSSGCSADERSPTLPPLAVTAPPSFRMTHPESPWPGPEVQRDVMILAAAGETPKQAIERTCGPQTKAFYRVAFEDPTAADNATFTADSPIRIPRCETPRGMLVRHIDSGDTLWKLHLLYGWSGEWQVQPYDPSFLRAIAELNPGLAPHWTGETNLEPTDFRPLQQGETINVPVREPATPQAVSRLEPILELQSDEECGSDPAPDGYEPYEIEQLLDALMANARHQNGRLMVPAKVLIADSGLYTGSSGAFSERVVFHAGDVDWKSYSAWIRPVNRNPKLLHGTYVASLALGGSVFARLNALLDPILVQLVVHRIYTGSSAGDVNVIDEPMPSMLRLARRTGASIVNLSLKSRSQLASLDQELGPSSQFLFVVAAGNHDGNLQDSRVYPARDGGTGRGGANVITVAAHDAHSRLASFSNYGPNWVDIAAPGCSVPVISYAEGRAAHARKNGTSIAAPLVSFTAGLIKFEFPSWTPIEIKRRILATADQVDGLRDKVMDGRVLQIVHALSLTDDIVVSSKGNELRGHLRILEPIEDGALASRDDGDLVDFCSDFSVRLGEVLRIAPSFRKLAGDRSESLIYYIPADEKESVVLRRRQCSLKPGLQLQISDPGDPSRTHTLELSGVSQVIRRSL